MKRVAVLSAMAIALAVVIEVVPSPIVRYGLAFVLLWLLPGLSWGTLISRASLDRIERLTVSLGLNFVITPVITLLITYLPGPLTRTPLIVAMVGIIGLPAVWSVLNCLMSRSRASSEVQQKDIDSNTPAKTRRESIMSAKHLLWREGWIWLLVAILIAGGLRTVNLNYSEFHNDEAKVMLRAARVMEGDEAVLYQHKKGPAQLTVIMSGWRMTGVTNEWMARLPFSWASILGIVAVLLCGRRLDCIHAGGIAACLLAVEGYLVGFGRFVQYQSLVFALSTLGLLCLLAYYRRGHGGLVVMSAAFFAGGVLAHYDAALVWPAGLLLIVARLWLDRRRISLAVIPVVIALAAGLALAGLFYFPFLRSPYVGHASSYISGRIGGHVYNNLWSSFELSAIYNSIYFLVSMASVLAALTMRSWAKWGRKGFVLSAILLVAVVTALMWPKLWVIKDVTLAWVPATILLAGGLLSPGQSMTMRSVWLWLGVPAVFYLFFVALPLTHVHTVFPAWAVLVGTGLNTLRIWLAKRSRTALLATCAGGVALYMLCFSYVIMLFVDYVPEYRRVFPQSKAPIYWTPYDQMPEHGLYGFPYRAGWKVVGHLIDEGQLAGSYASNERQYITDYYTRQEIRLDCASPDMYIVAVNVQAEVPLRWDQIEAEYRPAVEVTVYGQPKLVVYRRGVLGPPVTYRVEEYERLFDRGSTPQQALQLASSEARPLQLEKYVSREAVVGGFAHLLGYKIEDENAVPGGYVELILLWEALGPAPIDYQVFTHLHDGETMRGQLDGQPVCNTQPTSRWESGQYIVDPYRIPINGDALPGPVPLTIGMYDLVTMQRLPVSMGDDPPSGDSVYLTDLVIRTP